MMTTEASLIDAAQRSWQQNVERTGKYFGGLTEEQLLQPIAPGKNRLIYLWGHLTAVNDAMLPLLALGTRLHPELDEPFVKNPDQPSQKTLSGKELQRFWDETNQALWAGFTKLSPAEWAQRHTSVSEEDFQKEPHRNRFAVLLSRNAHLGYHLGQAILAKP